MKLWVELEVEGNKFGSVRGVSRPLTVVCTGCGVVRRFVGLICDLVSGNEFGSVKEDTWALIIGCGVMGIFVGCSNELDCAKGVSSALPVVRVCSDVEGGCVGSTRDLSVC